ncbi:pilin [Marinimicrobium alkaliphilum]|uniref:pilin n=1 Tax=Marinimicrobium alkaliphilum TaxID=2202654 RepID=UPI0038CBF45B
MQETGALRSAVENCMLQGRTTIVTGDPAPGECNVGWTFSNLLGEQLQPGLDVTITEDNTAQITATFGGNAAAALTTGEGQLQWNRTEAGIWGCSTNVDTRYRPAGCEADLGDVDGEDGEPT